MKTVDCQTLNTWLAEGSAVLVDVREPNEHKEVRITGAVPLPLAQVKPSALPRHEGKRLVMQCGGGGRSAQACGTLLAENPGLDVYNLEGGIRGWEAAGLPVKRTKGSEPLSLEAQTQIVLGVLVLAGQFLGFYAGPMWNFLTLAAGVGLISRSLAGYCYLTMLMAKMPWNKGKAAYCKS